MKYPVHSLLIILFFPFLGLSQENDKLCTQNWFNSLSKIEKQIIVNKGTEPPFSGIYNDHFEKGVYLCRACKNPLYHSDFKFDSKCGWAAFDDEIPGSIKRSIDFSNGLVRTEISCIKCTGHLGHVFVGEGYTKKNTRHCVNSISMEFVGHK